ncbi:MAG: hypothetical protein ACREO0_10560, partial [Pseudoxanthomonas sp.]
SYMIDPAVGTAFGELMMNIPNDGQRSAPWLTGHAMQEALRRSRDAQVKETWGVLRTTGACLLVVLAATLAALLWTDWLPMA